MAPALLTFLLFSVLFILIGAVAASRGGNKNADYFVANRSISAPLAGISTAATCMSGFTFTGLVGFIYTLGLAGLWFPIGTLAGSVFGFLYAGERSRAQGEASGALSFGELLFGTRSPLALRISSLLTITSLGAYAVAQFIAANKVTQSILHTDTNLGVWLAAGMVLIYCFAGGIRASIWTDAAQAAVMLVAMSVVSWACVQHAGGLSALIPALEAIDPALVNLTPKSASFGVILFALGWFFQGIGFAAWPHSIVRFLCVKDSRSAYKAVGWYGAYMATFFAIVSAAALAARVNMPTPGSLDVEVILTHLAGVYLPDYVLGILLAGVFASAVSTADSQILSCSAALVRELFPQLASSKYAPKVATLLCVGVVTALALVQPESVFALVMISIGLLSSAYTPLLFLRLRGIQPGSLVSLLLMIGGSGAAVMWRHAGLHTAIIDSAVGLSVGFLLYFSGVFFTQLIKRFARTSPSNSEKSLAMATH